MVELVEVLLAGQPSRRDRAECADFLWALLGDHVYNGLVSERGWSQEQYVAWISDTIRTVVLDLP